MGLANWILNLAALLLWLSWRSSRFDPLAKTVPATLAGTLKRAEPHRLAHWYFPLVLAGLLVFRGWLYRQIGPALGWTPSVEMGALVVATFRSDFLGRAMVFSVLSFGEMLALFYLWLLGLSVVNGPGAAGDSFQKLVGLNLGRVDRWPWPMRLVLPLAVGALSWLALSPLLGRWGIIPAGGSAWLRLEQGVILGLLACLTWKYLIGILLALHLLNSYVYLGNHPFWSFVALTGRNLLAPLDRFRLRTGRVDFAPVVGIALTFLIAESAGWVLTWLYRRLPF